MESLGEHLRRQRESKGLSLKDISEITKIGMNYLKYIEENKFNKIPGEVFVKGFLRSYARAVGINEDEIIEIYDNNYRKKEKKEDANQKIAPKRKLKIPSWLWIIPVLLITFLLFKALPQKKRHAPSPSRVVNKELNTAIRTEMPPPASQNIPQKLTLSIEAIEDTWVKVIIDGKDVKEALLKGGDKVNYEAEKNFGLTIGNAGGVKIKFDDKELGPLGPRGKVIRNFVLSKEGGQLTPADN